MARGGIAGAGIFLLILAIIGYIIPLNDMGWTAPEANDLCSSNLGKLGQLFSGDAQQVCSQMKYITLGIYGFGLIGLILIIIGAVVPSKSNHKFKEKSSTCKYCNFIAMSETELLKHNSEKHLDKSPYVCEHCDFIGITEEILWNHYNDEHPDKKKWKWN